MQVDQYIRSINILISNLKKAPYRRYRRVTVLEKITQVKTAYSNVLPHLEDLKESEQKFLLAAVRKVHAQALELLRDRLERAIGHHSLETIVWAALAVVKFKKLVQVKMAEALNLALAIRVVNKFDGNAQLLQSWLNDVDVLRASEAAIPEANFVSFVKSRLTGAARGAIDNVNTLAAAKTALRARFGIKLTPLPVEAELRSLTQKGTTLFRTLNFQGRN